MRIAIVALIGVLSAAQAPAPAPSTVVSDADLMSALKTAALTAPDMHTAPVKNTDRYRINVVRRRKPQGAIAHPGFMEVHHVIEGTGTLVTGGTIVRPAGATAGSATIDGGVSRRVAKGDVILVPAGAPHWYKDVDGTITYLEVRWEEK